MTGATDQGAPDMARDGDRQPGGKGARGAAAAVGGLPFEWLGRLIDAALDLDPETRAALAGLSGKVVDVEATGAGVVRLCIDGDRVRVGPRDEARDADVTVRGRPFSLLRFAFGGDRERLLLGSEVRLLGDMALATRLQQIAARMDIDLEEGLARRIGDVPAHELARGARGLGAWMRRSGSALLADVSEYLRHEARMTPGREEVERFVHDVDDTRDDVERLDARVARLERQGRAGPR